MDTTCARIAQQEKHFQETTAALDQLCRALDRYEAALPRLQAVRSYYESPLWLQDLDADQAGELPPCSQLPRGVLSEDGVDDLLWAEGQLRKRLEGLLSHS